VDYAVLDAPAAELRTTPDWLKQHLIKVGQSMNGHARAAVLTVGVNDSLVRHTELPLIPASDMRQLLKYNTKNYLQQELPDYVFDCFIIPPRPGQKAEPLKPNQKCRVLVGGAKRPLVEGLQVAAKSSGWTAEAVVPGLIGPANAFERAQPETFQKEAVALVDVGFENTSISLLFNGELMLTRVVAIGGDRVTNGIAEAFGVSYAEAEGIKLGLGDEVQSTVVNLLAPLGRELRASIDFFEHQQDRPITQVFVSGASARADYILQILQAELMVPCASWSPVSTFHLALPPQKMAEFEQAAPLLTVAVGAALAAL
jgi:Tfp pilus assembly PilM family ATPase